jgi:hypothetical protein
MQGDITNTITHGGGAGPLPIGITDDQMRFWHTCVAQASQQDTAILPAPITAKCFSSKILIAERSSSVKDTAQNPKHKTIFNK